MYAKTVLISLLAGLATAAPANTLLTSDLDPNKFAVISSHSGDPNVHLRSVSASGYSFYLNKATSTNCVPQPSIDCSSLNNNTVFAYNPKSQTLGFDEVVGGQKIYVGADGKLGYTKPSGDYPNDVYSSPWEFEPATAEGSTGTLKFEGDGFLACPVQDEETDEGQVYALFAGAVGGAKEGCTGVEFATAEWTGAQAYEYN